jgi:polyisoprenoid-binding protein YceI
MKKLVLLSLLYVFTLTASAEVITYNIDSTHSGINFKVRQFLSKIPGSFNGFEGEIKFDAENPANCHVVAIIQANSVSTGNDKRDDHLKNDDYFGVETHSLIEFNSTEWISAGDNKYIIKGILKLVGVEKEVTLDMTFLGEMKARRGTISGWEGSTIIDRNDWGITSGKPAIGDEVDVELNIRANR